MIITKEHKHCICPFFHVFSLHRLGVRSNGKNRSEYGGSGVTTTEYSIMLLRLVFAYPGVTTWLRQLLTKMTPYIVCWYHHTNLPRIDRCLDVRPSTSYRLRWSWWRVLSLKSLMRTSRPLHSYLLLSTMTSVGRWRNSRTPPTNASSCCITLNFCTTLLLPALISPFCCTLDGWHNYRVYQRCGV